MANMYKAMMKNPLQNVQRDITSFNALLSNALVLQYTQTALIQKLESAMLSEVMVATVKFERRPPVAKSIRRRSGTPAVVEAAALELYRRVRVHPAIRWWHATVDLIGDYVGHTASRPVILRHQEANV